MLKYTLILLPMIVYKILRHVLLEIIYIIYIYIYIQSELHFVKTFGLLIFVDIFHNLHSHH